MTVSNKLALRQLSSWTVILLLLLLMAFVVGYLPTATSTAFFRWQLLDWIVALIGVFSLVVYRPVSRYLSPWYRPIISFVVFGWTILFLTRPVSGQELSYAFLYGFRWLTYSWLIFFSLLFCRYYRRYLLPAVWTAVLGLALIGLVQYFVWPDIRPLAAYQWDPHYYRAVSTLLDPGYTGLVYTLGLVAGLVLITGRLKLPGYLTKKKLYFGQFILFLSLMLTYSRASYLAYLTALTVAAIITKSRRTFMLGIVLFLIAMAIIPHGLPSEGVKLTRQNSILARIISWREGIQTFRAQPLYGIGFNSYRFYARDHNFISPADTRLTHAGNAPDSSFLLVLATTGLAGSVIYLYLHYSHLKLASGTRSVRLLIGASWAAITVHSFFLNSWFYSHTLVIWYLILGFALTWRNAPSRS